VASIGSARCGPSCRLSKASSSTCPSAMLPMPRQAGAGPPPRRPRALCEQLQRRSQPAASRSPTRARGSQQPRLLTGSAAPRSSQSTATPAAASQEGVQSAQTPSPLKPPARARCRRRQASTSSRAHEQFSVVEQHKGHSRRRAATRRRPTLLGANLTQTHKTRAHTHRQTVPSDRHTGSPSPAQRVPWGAGQDAGPPRGCMSSDQMARRRSQALLAHFPCAGGGQGCRLALGQGRAPGWWAGGAARSGAGRSSSAHQSMAGTRVCSRPRPPPASELRAPKAL
jgi:hypothetical protein